MNREKSGFTTVELLITIAIIAMLVGLLLPALSAVRKAAKEAKQKAQLTTIELAIVAFKNDYGDYPPSAWTPAPFTGDYCGGQKLAEALVGWDLLGFHPKSAWRFDGYDGLTPNGPLTYDPDRKRGNATFDERKGPYLELATADAFRLGISAPGQQDGLFDDPRPLAANTYVICDVFGAKKITLAPGKTAIAGTPILYYKANTSGKSITNIYEQSDNDAIVYIKEMEDRAKHPGHPIPLNPLAGAYTNFRDYIKDPKITARDWPYRPDSYILISAGADGLYGTEDDIRNFGY